MIAFNEKFHLGDVNCSDKSLTHRAFILAAIADDVSTIGNVTLSRDVLCTVNALRAFGAKILFNGNAATVYPIRELPSKPVTIDCGNSGTSARLLAGLAVGLGVKAKFVGDESLSKRPMDRVVKPLQALGADIRLADDCLFVCGGGKLVGREIVAPVVSAQVKSAVLLSGLFAEWKTCYIEKTPTRNETELLLSYLGVKTETTREGKITVRPCKPHAFCANLPNDPSAAAYGVALAILKNERAVFENVLLNPRRVGFYNVLQRSGANIKYSNFREVLGQCAADIEVAPCDGLRPFFADKTDVIEGIDEIPLLAAMSLFVEGTHVFEDVGELRNKECDRIRAVEHIAEVCNQKAYYQNGKLTVTTNGVVPRGERFKTFDDHRIAMCETVLCVAVGGGSVNSQPFDVSHPDFLEFLGVRPLKLGLIGERVDKSISPRLQTYLAMNAGVCCSYDAITVRPDVTDGELLKIIRSYDGLNVTAPFKTRVAKLLNSDVPSVNTVCNLPCSTDGYGVVRPLQKHGAEFVGKPLWIVGAGGAAEACVCELKKYGCQMQILNRTEAHAEILSAKYDLPRVVDDPVGVLSFLPQCDFEKQIQLPPSCKFVVIADYMGESNIRLQAEKRALLVIDGREMNYYQGAKSFSVWTGTALQDDYEGYLKYVNKYDYI